MKKLFSLLTLALLSIGTAWATVYATYTVSLNNGATVTPAESTFFTVNSGGGYNSKYTGTYGGTEYTKGLKINSSSSITFTTTVKSDITIVQSTAKNGTNQFKLGGQTVAHSASGSITIGGTGVSYSMTENTTNTYKEFVFTDVPATTNLAITHDGETGLLYVKVELTEDPSAVTKLDAPEITFAAATGTVTIGAVTNATKVTYTTDGTAPTAESTTYSDPFVVEDGTVVKAIAIGTGSYSSSDVTSETVYRTGITCATPTINKFNGAVAITTTTPNATIKYSLNDGVTYNTYTRPFTLAVDATVKAYAERTGCTNSAEASVDVTVLATNKTKTIYLDYDDFTISSYTATGITGTVADGYSLAIGNTSKSWSSNGVNITTPGGVKKEFKLSNGAQNTLTIPAGVHVTKFRLYSVIMSADNSIVCGWKEVGEDDYQTGDDDYKKTPMGAYNNIADYNTNPDVREYAIDQTGGTITFTNAGTQLSFVIALDILEASTTITPANDKSTYVTPTKLDFSGVAGLTAYVATAAANGSVTLAEVGAVPANTPLMLIGTAGTEYTVPVAASASEPAVNMFRAGDGTTTFNAESTTSYDYILFTDGKFYRIETGTAVPVGKAYLHCTSDPTTAGAPSLSIDFGGTTGIDEVRGKMEDVRGEYYNLAGQRVAQPTKGLYIVNGRKVVIK